MPPRKKSSSSEAIPSWGWWVIGSVLGLIAGTWFILSGGVTATAHAISGLMEGLFGIVLKLFLVGLYFIPSLIAPKSPRAAAIFITNFIFGWTIIGWIIALIWAVAESGTMNARRSDRPHR